MKANMLLLVCVPIGFPGRTISSYNWYYLKASSGAVNRRLQVLLIKGLQSLLLRTKERLKKRPCQCYISTAERP